ncbi:hypothetical protein Cme02nite_60290 [Catellatospora methionotrophica]|uniref:Endonuclease/exonuclease/phosphatase domain-containing protein n=1 Tax=Catellatospora methionotrophica TaxID=121620 RepID=A0A8J3LB53_9ACTN|nr:endonuclease/exonuclease/phosphatase family protein [Catellatospora methionotrophica]GIG17697.1 hypothetical protein Cme02nite_60290 [Catellatospora methionotrophica]
MSRRSLALVALLFAVTAQLLRACGPLLDQLAGPVGIVNAALIALAIFAVPGVLVMAAPRVPSRIPLLTATTAGLVLAWSAGQVFGLSLALTAAGAVLAMAALALTVRRAADPVTATVGLLAGGVVDLCIRSLTVTWDPAWGQLPSRLGMTALVLVLLLLVIGRPTDDLRGDATFAATDTKTGGATGGLRDDLTAAATAAKSGGATGDPRDDLTVAATAAKTGGPLGGATDAATDAKTGRETGAGAETGSPGAAGTGRTWALGGYLALWTTTLGNPAFAASQSGVALQLCVAVLIVVLLVAIELVRRLTLHGGTNAIPEPDHWIAGSAALAGMVGGLVLAWWGTGPWVLLGIALTQLSATVAVARATAAPGNRGDWAYGLVWVLPVLLFQVHYDMPLPFDNRWLLIALGVALGFAGMGRRPLHPGGWRIDLRGLVARPSPATGVLVLALLGPALMYATRPPTTDPVVAGTVDVKVLSWNVKYGRDDATGRANPRQLADAIRAVNPDVVVLQEVSRGWAIGGGVDVAEYLSRELGMPFVWSPAADGQFGNLLLTRLPISGVRTGSLPYGQGPMGRSYLKATLGLDGRSLDVITAHLTHRKPNTPTRLAQIDELVAQVDPAVPTLVAGDFNFWPSWPEQRSFTGAGWVSAQDVTGHGAAWTSPTDHPTNRVDWVFGSPQLAFTDFAVLNGVTSSDHFPILATLTLR